MENRAGLNADAALFVAELLRAGSISQLARQRAVSPASVSARLKKLEAALGGAIVERQPGRWAPTDRGRVLARAGENIGQALHGWQAGPHADFQAGAAAVRICVPTGLGRHVMDDILIRFAHAFPGIRLFVRVENGIDDLISTGIDLSIRVATAPPPNIIARRLFPIRYLLCASPRYLAVQGEVTSPAALATHDFACASFMGNHQKVTGRHRATGAAVDVQIHPGIQTSDFNLIKEAVAGGLALAFLPQYMVAEELSRGELVPVLDAWTFTPYGQHAFLIRMAEKYVNPATRVLADFILAECRRR